MELQLALPLRQVLKSRAHLHLLDARGAISVTERAAYIGRTRVLARSVRAELSREPGGAVGFPMAPKAWGDEGAVADGCKAWPRRRKGAAGDGRCGASARRAARRRTPPKALKALGEAFGDSVANGLIRHRLRPHAPAGSRLQPAARLAVCIQDVRHKADDRVEQVKLLPVASDSPAMASRHPRFSRNWPRWGPMLRFCPARAPHRRKAESLFFERSIRGATLAEGLQQVLDEAIARLPIPRSCQYQLADGWTT